MREIKFRAWDRNEKKMVKITVIRFSDVQHTIVRYRYVNTHGKVIDDQSHIDEKGIGSIVLMQYTGLKDKNGLDVYEGDIIRGWYDHEVLTYKIVYGSDAAYYGESAPYNGIEGAGRQTIRLNNLSDWAEVIGNIYEHPHLLEFGKERVL